MKKFTAILLSFAIMISFVSGLAIQAETEDSCFTPDGITVGNTLGSIPTWMTFDITYGDKATDGYIAKINSNYNTSASTGNIYIKLPSSIWDTPISKLDFSFKCTDGTWGTRGNYVYLAPSLSNFSSNGIAIQNWFKFDKNGNTLTLDLSLDTYANAVSGKYCYLILSNGGVKDYYTGTEMLLTDVLVYSGEVTNPIEQTVFEFEAENIYKSSSVVGTVKTASYPDSGSSTNYTYVAHDESNVTVGDSIEYTFSGLNPGSYLIDIYARCTATRSTYALTAYDFSNDSQDLGSVNFADWCNQYIVSGYQYYCKSTLPTKAVVSKGNSLTLKFTVSAADKSGSCIDKFVLTKVETDGTTTNAISTEDKASIRLGETINGIRFYTTVVASNLTTLVGSNEYELGTLIGPADKIGTYLTYDDVTSGNAVDVKYQYKESGEYVYHTDATDSSKQSIVGSLVSIKDTNYNRSFVARGYVKVKNADDTYTYYYSSETSTRTIAGIADAFIADTSSDYHIEGALTPTVKALVDAWAAANN